MDLKELYQEIILDHGKNPRNFGKCKNFTSDAKGHNPLCGDRVHIYAQLDKDKKKYKPLIIRQSLIEKTMIFQKIGSLFLIIGLGILIDTFFL